MLPLAPSWPKKFGISLGDYAAVILDNHLAFAVFADEGPRTKLGEGFLALLRQLAADENVLPHDIAILLCRATEREVRQRALVAMRSRSALHTATIFVQHVLHAGQFGRAT